MGKSIAQHRYARRLLLSTTRNPVVALTFSDEDWDLFLRIGRQTSLLGWLAARLEQLDMLAGIPHRALGHLQSALVEVAKLQQMGAWEVDRILWALKGSDIQITLLKGIAYHLADLPVAKGRPFSDVDLMVPAARLEEAARILEERGWTTIKTDSYDQYYYREWMHELAPMCHPERETIVDLHHAIAPRTSRLKTDADKLLADSKPLDDHRLRVLSPLDMIIHSAVHLFHDGDMVNGLRDLLDLDGLIRHCVAGPVTWSNLLQRSEELGAARPVFYALRYSNQLLETPVPTQSLDASKIRGPGWLTLWIMDRLVPAALIPPHPDFKSRRRAFSRWLLYLRSHYLRMPWHLLIPHLVRKCGLFPRHPKTG